MMRVFRLSGARPALDERDFSLLQAVDSGWQFRRSVRWRRLLVVLLLALFVTPGLVGHAPWKQDETYTLGIILHMLNSHDWVVPTLTGRPFMEKPPLFDIVASGFVRLFSPWLPVHDAARLASGFFTALTLGALWLGAIGWRLRHRASVAALALIGAVGLAMPAHTLFTDVALLAGFSVAYAGFAWARRASWYAGVLIGTGVGIGFMSKGLLAPGIVGVTALLLPALFRPWRTAAYARSLLIAFVVALPWLLIWPIALYHRSPALFMQWFWQNNIGRYLGFSVARLGASNDPLFWWKSLPWFTFPLLPMALYALYRRPAGGQRAPLIQFAGTAVVVTMLVLLMSASARTNYALPMLPPLALLAACYRRPPPPAWRRRLWWAAVAFWGLLAATLWGIWSGMQVTHHVPLWTPAGLPRDFRPDPRLVIWAPALAMTLLWLALIVRYRRHPRPLLAWVGGLILVWGLLATLLLPWINAGKTYRPVFTALGHALPARHGCVANIDLGESERAMLQYYDGLITDPRGTAGASLCRWLIVEKHSHFNKEPPVGGGWHQRWTGHRDGDPTERFWLYSRSA